MKKLFLMRHAKSNLIEPNQTDFDRTLSERGKKDAPEMGKRLKKIGVKRYLPPQIKVITRGKKRSNNTHVSFIHCL